METKKSNEEIIKRQNAGKIALNFIRKRTFTNTKKGTVTVETTADVDPKSEQFKRIYVACSPQFRKAGVAKVSGNDKFDVKTGYLIASARSENLAYLEAIKYLKMLKVDAEHLLDAINGKIDLLKEAYDHNKDFIKKVASENDQRKQ